MDREMEKHYLRRTARINEEIKSVVRISESINLTAINAMLVAKRAGRRSLGYGIVSGELRNFSRQLESVMEESGMLISGIVRDAAALSNQTRSLRQMERASGMSDRTVGFLGNAMEMKSHAVLQSREKLDKLGLLLERHTRRAMRICQGGIFLVSSAKIEAVYGDDMASTLNHVSLEIEKRMNELLDRLKLLGSIVQAWIEGHTR